jgi:type IV secretion system protein VirB5
VPKQEKLTTEGCMKMKLKKNVIYGLFTFAIISQANATGIPVVDVAGIAQMVQQGLQLKSQIDNQIQQIQQLQAQVQSQTGNRNLGQIFNNPELRNTIPNEWTDLYDQMKSGNYAGAAKTIADKIKAQEGLKSSNVSQQRIYDTIVNNKALNIDALQKTKSRIDNIQQLMATANTTNDTKAAADLTNRMLAESASIQADQMRINLMIALQQSEERIAEKSAVKKSMSYMWGD